MPICIIAIKPDNNQLSEEKIQYAEQIGRASLKALLKGLNIPEFDQELRIVRGKENKFTFAFTVGGVEYPEQFPDIVFDPDEQKIREVGKQIKELVGDQPLTIETYKDSAFMMIDPKLGGEAKTESLPPSILETDGELNNLNVDVKLTVTSNQHLEAQSASKQNKELLPQGESEIFNPFSQALTRITENNIGREHQVRFGHEIVLEADAPAAVEVKINNDTLLSKDGLFRLAVELNEAMVQSNLTGEGSSIWVTQEAGRTVYSF